MRGMRWEPPAVLFATIMVRIVFIISSVEGLQLHAESHRQQWGPEIIVHGKKNQPQKINKKPTKNPWASWSSAKGHPT